MPHTLRQSVFVRPSPESYAFNRHTAVANLDMLLLHEQLDQIPCDHFDQLQPRTDHILLSRGLVATLSTASALNLGIP